MDTYPKSYENHPLVSIVIPLYNQEIFIEECLPSLQNQTYENIEIVIVDDESTDEGLARVKTYAEKDPRIHVFERKNSGVSDTRNAGMEKARGEYILFVDPDDWIEERTVETALSLILENECGMVRFGYRREPGKEICLPKDSGLVDSVHQFRTLLTGRDVCAATVWGALFRTSTLKEFGIVFTAEMTRSEDVLFLAHFYAQNISTYCLREPLYHYRQGSGVSGRFYNGALEQVATFCNSLLVLESTSRVVGENKDAVYDYGMRFYISALCTVIKRPALQRSEAIAALKESMEYPPLRQTMQEGIRIGAAPWWARTIGRLVSSRKALLLYGALTIINSRR